MPLRGVFSADDAWTSTGDLFRMDRDKDLWLVDAASAAITTAHGAGSRGPLAVAAVTLRAGRTLDFDGVNRLLEGSTRPNARALGW